MDSKSLTSSTNMDERYQVYHEGTLKAETLQLEGVNSVRIIHSQVILNRAGKRAL